MPEDFDHAAAQTAFMEHVDAQDDPDVGDANEIAAEIADAPEDMGAEEGTPAHENVPEPAVSADPYEQYGGEDTVKNAMIVANALKTEAGIRQLTARGLQTLGYNSSDIEAFLASQAAAGVGVEQAPEAPAGLFADREDDDLLTVAEARAFQETIQAQIAAATQQAQQPFIEQQAALAQQARVQAADAALIQAIGDPTAANPHATVDPEVADIIVRIANSYVPDGVDPSPDEVAYYIQQAHAAVVKTAGEKQAARLAGKRAAKDSLPTKVGGQGAGADAPREPQNLKEADNAFFALLDLPAPPR